MKTIWSRRAENDLADIESYIAEHDPIAAPKVVARIVGLTSTQLPSLPQSGRAGRIPGTRELVVTGGPYLVVYRIAAGNLEIIRVLHGARDWPDRL